MSDAGRTLPLPWERRRRWLGRLASRSRWRSVLAVAAVILAVVGVWRTALHRHRMHLTHAAVDEVRRSIHAFRADVGRCPESTDELVHPPRTGTRYLRSVPPDGWGRQLFVACPGRRVAGEPDVASAGPSGDFFVDDNVW